MSKKELQEMKTEMDAELQKQLDTIDDGADTEIIKLMKLDGEVVLKTGDDEKGLGKDVDVIILGMMPLGRGCHEGAYDPKNVSTPVCFSLDAKTPHELARPPQVVDRASGKLIPATSCKGKTGNCTGMIGENTCGWKRHIVVVLRSDISVNGMISFPIPSAALFNKGDVKNNPDPDNKVGLELYYKKVKSLPTANGKPAKMFQVVTTVSWHKQNERGETFTFSCIDKDGNIQQSSVDDWKKCIELMQTDEYKKMLTRYDDYLISGAERRLADEAENDDSTSSQPEPSLDELAD